MKILLPGRAFKIAMLRGSLAALYLRVGLA